MNEQLKKCLTEECNEHGKWESDYCPGCRNYLARVEKKPLRWRIERRELVMKWASRLGRTMGKNVVPLRSHKHASK